MLSPKNSIIIFLSVCFFVLGSCCYQRVDVAKTDQVDKNGIYLEYKDSSIASVGRYKKGRRHGRFISTDSLGNKVISHYTKGKLNGKVKHYHSSGVLFLIQNFRKDSLISDVWVQPEW